MPALVQYWIEFLKVLECFLVGSVVEMLIATILPTDW